MLMIDTNEYKAGRHSVNATRVIVIGIRSYFCIRRYLPWLLKLSRKYSHKGPDHTCHRRSKQDVGVWQ